MTLGFIFIVALFLSFVTSLPLGLITLNVVQKTIQDGRKSGIVLSLGATLIEFVYTYIALISLDLFEKNAELASGIELIATLTFFAMGFYFLWKKQKKQTSLSAEYNSLDFLQGVLIGAMNVLIIPFWIIVAIWLIGQGMVLEGQAAIISFSLGSAIGAFFAFWGYAYASERIVEKMDSIARYTDKVIGFLFLGLGVFQLGQLLWGGVY